MKKERGRNSGPLPSVGEGGPRISEGRERGGVPTSIAPSPGSLRSPPSPAKGGGSILLGEFGRAHGLKGEVRLKSMTGDPLAIGTYGPLLTQAGQKIVLKNLRPAPGGAPDMLITQVEGVSSREGAEALNRVQIYLEREKLPQAEEDEFLHADLIGLAVKNEAGETIGTIVAVPNYGGGDLLEIAPLQKGPTALLPFVKAFVPHVDLAQKCVTVVTPEDFFEPARPQGEDEA
ncbi:ribosome maturation factor RimM [Microvirga flavescens]|uniref:ribosome maturation factor RimM n=1 Tax=Microvirga flavescens TaxID=2249811 RepID=UPI000DD72869|nr:ribosome maturation factor RimM [Microvirga flavescens]